MTTNTGIQGPLILTPKKNIVLDATVLSTLMSCARLADFRFNYHFESVKGKSNSLEVGSIVHKVLEVAYRLMSQGHKKSDAIATGLIAGQLYAEGCPYCTNFTPTNELLNPPCKHEIDEYPGVINTPVESESWNVGWKHALKTAEEYFEFYKNDAWVSLEVETVKGKILYEDDNIRVLWKAKLDWIVDTNQGIFPVDHKTSKQRREKIKLNSQFMGQCMVMGTRNMIVNNIGFQKTLKANEKFTREVMSYPMDLLLEWTGQILPYWAYKLLDYTEEDIWPANFTHCENKYGNCPFIKVCESNPDMRESELNVYFRVGKAWDPTNIKEDE